jgi:predicted RNase H-like HicB family nuclease
MLRHYSIVLEPEPEAGGFSVSVPALPGCHTQGETVEECIANAREAIAAWIADAEDHGEPIPEERVRPQIITVDVAA